MKSPLQDLVAVSREFGSDPKWVVAGGGNTSVKVDDVLYIKASGFPLATIGEDGFARMDRKKLAAIWNTRYPEGEDVDSVAERETLVLADMMAARLPGEERRPSVETVLHDLLPWPLVVHLHPTLVNGLTCGVSGPEAARTLFGDSILWIPVVDPGYILAKVIRDAMTERAGRGFAAPDYIFLANHGMFAGGEDAQEIRKKYSRLQSVLETRLRRRPGKMPVERRLPGDEIQLKKTAGELFGGSAELVFLSGGELDRYLPSAGAASPLTGSLTPDHIVYAGPGALYIGAGSFKKSGGSLGALWKEEAAAYTKRWGKAPNLTLVYDGGETAGVLVAAGSRKALDNAILLLENALEVCAFAESFGGYCLMEEKYVRFIVNWEVENYRSKQASG
jgi:rhamnose utilization protein RhaD (predicted bifunctional aldolase and dehydrogenase)